MKLEIELGKKSRTVDIDFPKGRLRASIDGRGLEADAVEVGRGLYSILIEGDSFEAFVAPAGTGLNIQIGRREYSATIRDPRQWRRNRGAALEAEGRQQVTAPMPGRIIRVLVKTGDPVQAGQGILVVEAMKMQNEVRSPKSGVVEGLLVSEGQTVNAGDPVAIVT